MNELEPVIRRWREPGSPPALDLIYWVGQALCAVEGGEWFPEQGARLDVSIEKAICGRCPVREACLAYALDRGERWGIWGGLTDFEREALVDRLLGLTSAAGEVPAVEPAGGRPSPRAA